MRAELAANLAADVWHRFVNSERRADRTLGIIAARTRDPKHSHHSIAQMFVDRAAVFLNDGVNRREIALQEFVELFEIELFTELGKSRQVGEHHGRLSKLACRRSKAARAFIVLDRLNGWRIWV